MLYSSELKGKVGWESETIAFGSLVEPLGCYAVQSGEIRIENRPVAVDRVDQRLKRLVGYLVFSG